MEPFIRKVMKTKSCSWRHEAEVRLLIAAEVLNFGPDSNGVNRWWLPTDEEHVVRIDLGIRFTNEKLVEELKTKLSGVEIHRAPKNPDAFLCKYEQIA